jgi:hypothetical protein
MADLQDLVYSVEVGSLRKWILRVAVLLLILLLGVYYLGAQFNGLSQATAMDQAQIARQISQGEGFTTKFIRPVILKFLTEESSEKGLDVLKMPDLVHPPVYPYLLATAFKLTGVSFEVDKLKLKELTIYRPEMVIGGLNLLLFMGAMVIFYLWVSRAFDDRVAVLASCLLVATDSIWQFVVSGLNVALLLFLVCGMAAALHEALAAEEEEEKDGVTLAWLSLAALLGGVMFMTRYSMVVFPLGLAVAALFLFRRRGLAVVVAVAVPLLVSLHWLIRNFQLTGNPFGYAWLHIYAYDSVLWRMYGDSLAGATGLKALAKALGLGLGNQIENLGYYFGGFLLPGMFFVSLLHVFRRRFCQNSRWFWLGVTVLALVANAVVVKLSDPQKSLDLNGLIVLAPIFAAYGSAHLCVLVDRMKLPSNVLAIPILAIVVGIQLVPLAIKVGQKSLPRFVFPPYFPPVLFLMRDWVSPQEVQSADIPWAIAWYCDSTTLWIPHKRKDFDTLIDTRNGFHVSVSTMLFTPESANLKMFSQIQGAEYGEWKQMIMRSDLRDLPLPFVTILPPKPNFDYLYFSDRPRWK